MYSAVLFLVNFCIIIMILMMMIIITITIMIIMMIMMMMIIILYIDIIIAPIQITWFSYLFSKLLFDHFLPFFEFSLI